MIRTAPPVQAPAWVRHAAWWHDELAVRGIKEDRPGGDDKTRSAFSSGRRRPAHTAQLDALLGSPVHASSPPADPTVLEVPSHGWEVAF
jgi:hypothetical protein